MLRIIKLVYSPSLSLCLQNTPRNQPVDGRTTSVLLSWIEAEPCYGTMDLVFTEFHDSETSGHNISFSNFINSHYNDTVRGGEWGEA